VGLKSTEVSLLAYELAREFSGAVVQKVSAPTTTRLYLDLRVPGLTCTLVACVDAGLTHLGAVEKRPPNPPQPPTWQHVLRRELEGARIATVDAWPSRRCLAIGLTKGPMQRTMMFELSEPGLIALLTDANHVVTVSGHARDGIRPGARYQPPPDRPSDDSQSRLQSDRVKARLLFGAAALFEEKQQSQWRAAVLQPIEAKLKRLKKTRVKVEADLRRTEQAQTFRDEGIALTAQLSSLVRGQTEVLVPHFDQAGQQTMLRVKLDPTRTPKQEVEWRFHQYRRLQRGASLVQQRLVTLEREESQLLAERDAALSALHPMPVQTKKAVAAQQSKPYREYRGHADVPIWVGRGAQHNDTLSFQIARPFHLWFHARGVPGAHVVACLAKNAEPTQELILDAAHLAAHHSDAKGEPKVEVSYLPVKALKKPKGAAAGAVSYSQEKTFVLRIEATRLAKLLASES
jgi:predicted ribosome quality control (RQC) complex YloA/Tae2 family protein